MKQLLFLLLFPCLALAQYQGNAGQKITLGEQTTADGLVYRGVENDTALITPLSDTSAYIILDTVNNRFYNYNRATNVWSLAGGDVTSFSAGTTGLTPSTATTGAVTLGGTLAVANGGTGTSTAFTAGSVVFAGASGTYTQDNANLFWDDSNNRLGIGTASPTEQFHVNGNGLLSSTSVTTIQIRLKASGSTTGFDIQSSANDGYLWNRDNGAFYFGTNDTERMRITNGGEIYVAGTTDRGAYNLQVNGTGVWGEGAYVNGSDANIKENIVDLDSSLIIVNNLKPVIFNYIKESVNNDTKHLGFIAQDVYQTLSNKDYLNSIVRSDGDTLSIAYSNLIPLLTKAIQEQQALIKALEQRLLILENK